MIVGLKGAYLLCNLGILENATFIKLSERMFILWGTGFGAARRGWVRKSARTSAVEANGGAALGGIG